MDESRARVPEYDLRADKVVDRPQGIMREATGRAGGSEISEGAGNHEPGGRGTHTGPAQPRPLASTQRTRAHGRRVRAVTAGQSRFAGGFRSVCGARACVRRAPTFFWARDLNGGSVHACRKVFFSSLYVCEMLGNGRGGRRGS